MNDITESKNLGFISTEDVLASKAELYFKEKGWKVEREMKLRGRVADIVAVKGDEIALVEVKGSSGNIQSGIEQALHQKKSANFSYLAIPQSRLNEIVQDTCKNMGIGLLLVMDKTVKEVVKPSKNNVLFSVQKIVLGVKPKKQEQIQVKSSLENIFRSKGQILILKLLFLHSHAEFYLNDIARTVGASPSTISKEMPILLKMELVTKRIQGNLVFYKINNKGIIHDEMRRIFLKYELLDDMIAKDLPKENIKYALIHGSFAKGTESETSDVDLLLVGDVTEGNVLRSTFKTGKRIGREINFTLWKEKEFLQKVKEKTPLIKEISKTPVIMILGDKDEFKRDIE